MANDQIGGALGNATGITRGLPSWKEGLAKLLEVLIDTPKGAIVGSDASSSPSQKLGELLSALPMLGGVKAAQGAVKKGIKAFHGSPHDFDKFSLSKIGTGEGAQAYGHGLYFAEQPAVAQEYKNKLTAASDALIGGRPVSDVKRELLASARDVNMADEAHAKLRFLDDLEEVDAGKDGLSTPAFDEALRRADPSVQAWAKSLKGQYTVPKGRMYEVSINADPEDFLDWDAPLSQQSEKVRQALGRVDTTRTIPGPVEIRQNVHGDKQFYLVNRSSGEWGTVPFASREEAMAATKRGDLVQDLAEPDGRGGLFIDRLRSVRGGDPSAASSELKQAGIPGIKYLDGASRSAGQGSRNYVVFDDALIEIKRKFGFMLPIMGAAGFEQWARQKAAEETGVNPMDALAERKW